jgi:hypothetical protein
LTAFEERGLFWWHHEEVPEGYLSPASAVSGLLKIDQDGLIILELDVWLEEDSRHPTSVLSRGDDAKLSGKQIEGLLKVSNKRVLLNSLWKHGGRFSTNGMSYEGYGAAVDIETVNLN